MPTRSDATRWTLATGPEQLEARALMSAGHGVGNGPPDWAVARGHRDEVVTAPPAAGDG